MVVNLALFWASGLLYWHNLHNSVHFCKPVPIQSVWLASSLSYNGGNILCDQDPVSNIHGFACREKKNNFHTWESNQNLE